MASDYIAIRTDNERRYGTDIGRIGPMLLADRYDDRTHFIFELLQNAEDALAKRTGWNGQRSVRFHLLERHLQVSHFGKPFDEQDVRGICGIAESTKDLTAIGRFGIGFKSVYAFTDRPEVHSGSEHFAIESFVWPVAVPPVKHQSDETLIALPLREATDREEIITGLKRLGPSALLFLREIEEIEWNVEHGPSGLYLRSHPENLGDGIRSITVIGQAEGHPDVEEAWLVFSKPVYTLEGKQTGHVELAFYLTKDDKSGQQRVRLISRSPLIVFFPTVLETHLRFLAQGPYRTTPSRDNVPPHDAWNQHCVKETATVLREALRWLRDKDMLDVGALRCLPLDRLKFGENSMFEPIFKMTKEAFANESLLPRYGGGHVSARQARLARTQELRELFSPAQLAAVLGTDDELAWLSSDISQDRTPDLREYLIDELDVEEMRFEMLLPKFNVAFLEAQSDDWVRRLYEFLGTQKALLQRAKDLPLIRLTSGKHVRAYANSQPQAFLPGAIETGFPTLKAAVCNTNDSLAFLRMIGLTEPDPVDDVIRNVLPKYRENEVDVADDAYEADIHRILAAFATDSKAQREKLLEALRKTPFVMAVDTGDASKRISMPSEVYLATDRLKELFAGVPNVLRVDDVYSCLRGENVRELLEACGALRYLRPVTVIPSFTWDQLHKMRIEAGCESMSASEPLEDYTLHGLDNLLVYLQRLDSHHRMIRAQYLWDALADLVDRRGSGVFSGTYRWYYYYRRSATFDAKFVRLLNEKKWVPDADGNLQQPNLVLFESLGWKPNPLLLSKIRFKPPIIDQLAREAGIEPGLLDLLKKLGVTSEAELRARLLVNDEPTKGEDEYQENTKDAAQPSLTVPLEKNLGTSGGGATTGDAVVRPHDTGTNETASRGSGMPEFEYEGSRKSVSKRTPGRVADQSFVSYVGTHPDEDDDDPDGLDRAARMALEARAIDLILAKEPTWHRTPAFNPGYDLFEVGSDAQPNRWCEVKAMTGSLENRPVGLSRTQFECAREHGKNYWLYVVEHAASKGARIIRIQDPAGKSRTFTFDHGWISVAEVDNSAD